MSKIININYDEKSLQETIKRLELINHKLKNIIPPIYLDRCLDYVIARANEYLDNYIIDRTITSDIQTHWNKMSISKNKVKLVNYSDKAVFIEFGVGRVGAVAQHPNSSQTGYQYNIPSKSKDRSGQWAFSLDDKNGIDLVAGYYRQKENVVITKGSPANMYLYNAMLDLVSSGMYKVIWDKVLEEQL